MKIDPLQRIWLGGNPQVTERIAVSKHDRLQRLVDTMTSCLAELDSLEAYVAGAHLDSALQALQRQLSQAANLSKLD